MKQILGVGILVLFLVGQAGSAAAKTELMKGAEVNADPETLKAILKTFYWAEKALQKESLPEMMVIYSKGYENRGLRKEDTSRIWADIFGRFDHLTSRHLFSRVIVDRENGTARVTCTGALLGKSILNREKGSPPVQVDVWFEAVHQLVLEDGNWKIIGHDPRAGEENPFGSAIHLLF